ncbi:hypothetical protein GCM10008024_02570 [Allgaiera indica]|uniref:VPLPA-CTERM protein sorting domain-containing protein n=1 Tax=Allgaiera indica TaxID=765699 RepID=A0AAN4UN01_9RHOB|nr:PEP-CTERM sorting domain-containing protein [Allgaiera indica]GHD98561.1 hypothetical protein GCM10008024_02570 [Allgaiera indica]SDW10918.1 VPLPA-CTERM protein sorting domain-containing protein [Allgaiera indica]
MLIWVKQWHPRRSAVAFFMAAALSLGATAGAAAPTPSSRLSGLPETVGMGLRHLGDTETSQIVSALYWLHHTFPSAPFTWMPGNGVANLGTLLGSLASWLHDGQDRGQGGTSAGGTLTPAEIFEKLIAGGAGLYGGPPRGPAQGGLQGSAKSSPPWTALLAGAHPFGGTSAPSGNLLTSAGPGGTGLVGSGSGGTGLVGAGSGGTGLVGSGSGNPTITGGSGPSSGTSRAALPSVVPLPATLPMLLLGLGALVMAGRRRRPAT